VLAAALAGLAAAPAPAQDATTVVPYRADYSVRYKGRRVARAEFSVTAEGDGQYVYSSSTKARGLLKLVAPHPAVDRSRFRVTDGAIRPSRFEYEDGSRKGDDNFSIDFDAKTREAHIATADGSKSVPFDAGLLDRGTLQVALMRDLRACRTPGPYRYVDDEGIETYRYERIDDSPAETGIGTLETVRFAQQRENSSRRTILWLAPELAFLPVRMEQLRDGEVETVFTLESLDGIERRPTRCSGLR
jgi:hypothetical protein